MTYYTILDFETTGLYHLTEQVIEIGAIKVDAEFNEVGRMHTMVQLTAGRKLPEFITKLTGITEEDTKAGITEVEALAMLKSFIGDSVVVAQFAPFDLSYLAKAVEPEQFIDTRSLSRILEPAERAGLKDICARYEINLEGHHRSINDCEATLQALEIMLKEIHKEYEPADYMNLVVDAPDRPLKFIPKGSRVINLADMPALIKIV